VRQLAQLLPQVPPGALLNLGPGNESLVNLHPVFRHYWPLAAAERFAL
jgi:hypothetical protein